MYGWRGRVGSISATPTDVFPREFYWMAPEGVSLVQSCLFIHEVAQENIQAAEEMLDRVALEVAKEGVDVLILGASPITYLQGYGYDRDLARRISELTGVPTISNQTAAVDALHAVGAKRIVVAAPYTEELLPKLKDFLEKNGLEVVTIKGLGLRTNAEITRVPPYKAYQFARALFLASEKAEGIYLPCANWPVALNIAKLENDLQVPVVASNQAKIWAALKALHIKEPIRGFGKLLAECL